MVKINPWVILGHVIILGSLYGLHIWDRSSTVKKEVTREVEILNVGYQKRINEQVAKTRLVETKLKEFKNESEKSKQAAISAIDSKLVVAINELRNERAKRPTPKANTPIAPIIGTCTGRELYAEDGEFLTREAARADKVVVERNYYYTQYENARKVLDEAAK